MGSGWWVVALLLLMAVPGIVIWAATARNGKPGVRPVGRARRSAATLDELERETRAPLEDQVVELPSESPPGLGTPWEIEQRRWLKSEGIGN